jgi:hypothetical protein
MDDERKAQAEVFLGLRSRHHFASLHVPYRCVHICTQWLSLYVTCGSIGVLWQLVAGACYSDARHVLLLSSPPSHFQNFNGCGTRLPPLTQVLTAPINHLETTRYTYVSFFCYNTVAIFF